MCAFLDVGVGRKTQPWIQYPSKIRLRPTACSQCERKHNTWINHKEHLCLKLSLVHQVISIDGLLLTFSRVAFASLHPPNKKFRIEVILKTYNVNKNEEERNSNAN